MRMVAIAGALVLVVGAGVARADDFRDEVAVRAGGTLTVDLPTGALRIETHDAERVEADAVSGGWGGLRFTLTSDGENAHLVGERKLFPFPFLLTSFGTRVRVRVPEDYSLDLHTAGGRIEVEAVRGGVRARTSGGPIDLRGAVGPVELRTSGGQIRIEDVRGDTVARTSGGSITADDIVGALEVKTSGGPIRLRDIGGGPIRAHTSGGSIEARFASAAGGELETSGGSIDVEFAQGSEGVDLEAKTSGGRVSIDGELTVSGDLDRGHVRGRIRDGGEHLLLKTSGGDIRVITR